MRPSEASTVGQRVDGRVEFEVSDDGMSLTLTVHPAMHGGDPAQHSVVIEQLRAAGIVHGLDEERIKSLVARSADLRRPITGLAAEGTPPEPGTPAKFELLVSPPERRPAEGDDATGTVDYHFDAPIINVHEGQEVARRTAPTEGKPGKDLFGRPVAPPPVEDRTPRPMLRIATMEDRGVTRYYATEAGELRYDEAHNTITVATEYTHKGDVTVTHGDINFVRDVAITGNVTENAVIRAGGNVRIVGTVGAATIEAGGDVTVTQGIVGGGRGMVSARGNVEAAFAESATIRSGGDVTIRKAVLNSDISASGSVLCTQGMGTIIGGVTRAVRSVEVRRLGAPTGAETQVIVGFDWALLEQRNQLRTRIAWCAEAVAKADRVLGRFGAGGDPSRLPEEVRASVAKTSRQRDLLQEHLNALREELASVEADLAVLPGGVVKVSGEAFAGVKVTVGDARLTLIDTVRYCAMTEDRETGEVAIGALT